MTDIELRKQLISNPAFQPFRDKLNELRLKVARRILAERK